MAVLPCNWLQIQENSLDPHHVDYLHNRLTNYVRKRQGLPPARVSRKTKQVAFDVFEYGIMKRRLWEGDDEDSPEWTVGHAMVFPNGTLLPGTPPEAPHFQWRVPVDDTHTLYLWYNCRLAGADGPPQRPEDIPLWENAFQHENGRYMVETVSGQDMMAWITQGPIADRTGERLGTSDKGIVLFRQLLMAEMAKIERGEDPMGTIRDPARNQSIYIPREERYPSRVESTVDYRSLQFARRELVGST
jgi:5,5'-dehydrodivanillate O-demethylase oxygenase subunit